MLDWVSMIPAFEDAIFGFSGETGVLSNFTPCEVTFDSQLYPSVEHAYQAAKTYDLDHRSTIKLAYSAGHAKRLGKQLVLRSNWNSIRIDIMRDLLIQKFNIPEMRGLLLDTGDKYIEETNSWGDTFWGVCNGVGNNVLGNLLMEIRTRLHD